MDVDLTIGISGQNDELARPKPSIIYIQSVSEKKQEPVSGLPVSIADMELTIHLESAIRKYGIDNTDELYSMLKSDAVNMKKKLRGGYRYLVERLKELGYEITEEMKK